ncbi:MAG: YbbR-like domain-containing protein [Pelobium sp.]
MALIKLTAVERRKLSIFFTCLVLAVLVWLFYGLKNKYEYEVRTAVNFKNLPVNKAFNPLQSDTVTLTVQGTGWQLLFTRMRIYPRDVKVDLNTLNRRNFVTFTEQMNSINSYYSSDQKIISVQPDTLYFDFTTRKVKKVPVKLLSDLSFVKQFGQSGLIELKPDYVTITGPQEALDNIHFWTTDTFRANGIDKTLTQNITFKNPKEANIAIFPATTDVKVPVEEFTEKSLNIPIKVIHNQQYYNVKLIPEKVRLVFMVSLSDYANVKEDNFEAVVDLDLWKNEQVSQLPVQIIKKATFTRIRRVEPIQVNFMIKK